MSCSLCLLYQDLLSTEGACVLGMEGVLTDDDMLAIVKVGLQDRLD